jgi:hypothetical protein
VQVSLLVDQVDQYDQTSSSHAALKGIRAEPQQPELPRLRQALAAADKVVLLAEGADVSGRSIVSALTPHPHALRLLSVSLAMFCWLYFRFITPKTHTHTAKDS